MHLTFDLDALMVLCLDCVSKVELPSAPSGDLEAEGNPFCRWPCTGTSRGPSSFITVARSWGGGGKEAIPRSIRTMYSVNLRTAVDTTHGRLATYTQLQ